MRHLDAVPPEQSGGATFAETLDATLTALMSRTAGGDEDAFAALYDRTSSRVHGVVLRVLRDPSQAEEVTQETFLEMWRTAARFDATQGSVLAWLLTLAHRRAVDRVRSSEASRRRDTGYGTTNIEIPHDETAERAQSSAEATRVRQALASLSERQREAIQLAYFGGYTHTEVATMLDLPLGTAKTRIRDGLMRLRDVLGVSA